MNLKRQLVTQIFTKIRVPLLVKRRNNKFGLYHKLVYVCDEI